jgi:hypothetical protein
MPKSVCQSCGNSYTVNTSDTDDGFCCFDCWEEANCSEPEEYRVPVEELAI